MKDYHDLKVNVEKCLKVNVLLLACVCEIIMKESINCFELDPCYLSTLDNTWDGMKRFTTCVKLKLISDIKKYQFIESMIVGGIFVWFVKVMLTLKISSKNHVIVLNLHGISYT